METIVEYERKIEVPGESLAILQQANEIAIYNEEDRLVAGNLKAQIKAIRDPLFKRWDDMRDKSYKAYQKVKNNMDIELAPFDNAIQILQESLDEYVTKIENERRAAQAKLEVEAREKARIEQEKFLAQAVEIENKREDLLAAAEKAELPEERVALYKKALKFEAKQEVLEEKAENVYPEPQFVQPYIPKKVELESGGSMGIRKDIEVVITDEIEVLKLIVAGKATITLIRFEIAKIKKWCVANNLKGNEVPGLLIKEKSKSTQRK